MRTINKKDQTGINSLWHSASHWRSQKVARSSFWDWMSNLLSSESSLNSRGVSLWGSIQITTITIWKYPLSATVKYTLRYTKANQTRTISVSVECNIQQRYKNAV